MKKLRLRRAVALSLALHAPALAGYAYHSSKTFRQAAVFVEETYTSTKRSIDSFLLVRKRRALKKEAKEGRMSRGEFVVRANHIDAEAEGRPFDLQKSLHKYNHLLRELKSRLSQGKDVKQELAYLLHSFNYHGGVGGKLGVALIENGGPCGTVAHLIACLVEDAGRQTHMRYYGSHLAPLLIENGKEFDLTSGTLSVRKGILFRTASLIDFYNEYRGGFDYPPNDDGFPGYVPFFKRGAVAYFTGADAPTQLPSLQGDDLSFPPFFLSVIEKDDLQAFHSGTMFGLQLFPDLTSPPGKIPEYSITIVPPYDNYDGNDTIESSLSRASDIMLSAQFKAMYTLSDPEKAFWMAMVVAAAQQAELYSVVGGKYELARAARRRKEDFLKWGNAIIDNVEDPVGFLNSLERYLDVRFFSFLPPKGPEMLVQLARHQVGKMRETETGNKLKSPYRLISLLDVPYLEEQIGAEISALPISTQAQLAVSSSFEFDTDSRKCPQPFCLASDAFHSACENRFQLSIAAGILDWKTDFPQFQASLRAHLRQRGVGLEWERPLLSAFSRWLARRNLDESCEKDELCTEGSAKRSYAFKRELQSWLEENGGPLGPLQDD